MGKKKQNADCDESHRSDQTPERATQEFGVALRPFEEKLLQIERQEQERGKPYERRKLNEKGIPYPR